MTDSDDTEGRERRAEARHFICFPFEMQSGDFGDTGDAEIAILHDLSLSGAHLFVGSELAIGTRVKLHLDILEAPDPTYVVEGSVIRVERRDPTVSHPWPFGAAIHFSSDRPIDPAVLASLEGAITKLVGERGRVV